MLLGGVTSCPPPPPPCCSDWWHFSSAALRLRWASLQPVNIRLTWSCGQSGRFSLATRCGLVMESPVFGWMEKRPRSEREGFYFGVCLFFLKLRLKVSDWSLRRARESGRCLDHQLCYSAAATIPYRLPVLLLFSSVFRWRAYLFFFCFLNLSKCTVSCRYRGAIVTRRQRGVSSGKTSVKYTHLKKTFTNTIARKSGNSSSGRRRL